MFHNIRNEYQKVSKVKDIQSSTAKSNFQFNDQHISKDDIDLEQKIKDNIYVRVNEMLEKKDPQEQLRYIDIEQQQRLKEHISGHKTKSSFEWIQIKHYLVAWKEESFKRKVAEDHRSQQKKQDQESGGVAEQLLKNQIYKEVQKEQFGKVSSHKGKGQKSKQSKTDKMQEEIEKEERQIEKDSESLFKIPEEDLLYYLPNCTDIYLGND